MKTIVYIETVNGKPINGSLELLTPSSDLGDTIAVLIGADLAEAASQVAGYGTPVLLVDTPSPCPDSVLAVLEKLVKDKKPDAVLFSATQAGKDYAPRLAARLNTGCVTDATVLEADADNNLIFTRPAFGGTVLEQLSMGGLRPQIATIRSGSYAKPARAEAEVEAEAAVESVRIPVPENSVRAKAVKSVQEITETINLEGADVIVTGGRGMGNAENYEMVKELAALLGGVVGATRPAMEEGWISRAHQVGQSGKIVAPKLYIACGVSGSMQHISGIMGSKYIVAINKDEAASIFNVADVGIVGDVKEVMPVIIEEIRKRKEAF